MVQVMLDLRKDHRKMGLLLDILEQQIAPLRDGEEPDYEVMREIMTYCVNYPDRFHHPKEDIVYRRLIELGASASQVGDMEVAHQELRGLTQRLYDATEEGHKSGSANREVLTSLLESFVDSYRLHIDAEETVFFPLAEDLLSPEDWSAIRAEVAEMKDPLFGDRPPTDKRGLSPALLERMEQAVAADEAKHASG